MTQLETFKYGRGRLPGMRSWGRLLPRTAPTRTLWLFILATPLLTYPVAWDFTTRVMGDGADSNLFLWNNWWFAHALLSGENPYQTTAMYWPVGASLALHTLSPLNAAIAMAAGPFLGSVGAYNLLMLLSFPLSGFGAYLLARRATGSEAGAIVAGFAFGFAPYHYAHALGHLNLVMVHWLPFFLLFLDEHLATGSRRSFLLAAGMLVGAGLTDLAILLITGLAGGVWVLASRGVRDLRAWRRAAAPVAVAALALSPIAVMVARAYARAGTLDEYGLEAVRYSVDALSYLVPTPLSWLYGDWGRLLVPDSSPTEASAFLGYVLVALAVAGIAAATWQRARPWLLMGGTFLLLSLGPRLHVNGVPYAAIPTPYAFLQQLPFLSTLRTPGRFSIVVTLCVAVLAAHGTAWLLARLRGARPQWRTVLASLLVALVLAEMVMLPFPTSPVRWADAYADAADSDAAALVDLPLRQPGYEGEYARLGYMAGQTIHGLPMVNGYHSRETDLEKQFLYGELVLAALLRLESDPAAGITPDVVLDQPLEQAAPHLLKARGLTTIMFHWSNGPTEAEVAEWAFLQSLPGVNVTRDYGSIVRLEVEPVNEPPAVLVDLERGWYPYESWEGTPTRWTFQEATFLLDARETTRVNLTLRLQAYPAADGGPRHTTIAHDGEIARTWKQGKEWQDVSVTLDLEPGTNRITLGSEEPAVMNVNHERPDRREFAFAVRDVRVVPLTTR